MQQSEKTLISVLILSFALSGIYYHELHVKNIALAQKAEAIAMIEASNPFKGTNVEAKTSYVYDVSNEKGLFEKHADQKIPLASITKVMTAVVALDQVPEGTIV